jgi:hypothetical protein
MGQQGRGYRSVLISIGDFHAQLRGIAAGTTPLKKRRPNLVNGEK